jgi:ADP-ribose pyrophosphatase YjhB (NUDIX family)
VSEVPRIRVAALIVIDGQVVVVRHRKDDSEYHLLPGGGVEYGETLGHALQREVAEETGLACEIGRPLVLSDTIDPAGTRHAVNITFACRTRDTKPKVASDDPRLVGVELVSPASLPDLDLRPPIAPELVQALSDQDGYVASYVGSIFTPEQPGDRA